jgi:hypothetical protein
VTSEELSETLISATIALWESGAQCPVYGLWNEETLAWWENYGVIYATPYRRVAEAELRQPREFPFSPSWRVRRFGRNGHPVREEKG